MSASQQKEMLPLRRQILRPIMMSASSPDGISKRRQQKTLTLQRPTKRSRNPVFSLRAVLALPLENKRQRPHTAAMPSPKRGRALQHLPEMSPFLQERGYILPLPMCRQEKKRLSRPRRSASTARTTSTVSVSCRRARQQGSRSASVMDSSTSDSSSMPP